jgi:hypothetical protein
MAKSAAQRKREQLEREAAIFRRTEDATHSVVEQPFFQFLQQDGNWSSVQMALDLAGIEAPDFEDDRNPASVSGQIEDLDPATYALHPGSIGRAEVMFHGLLDAATELAAIINRYKTEGLDAAIEKLRSGKHETVEAQQAAIDEVLRLTRLRDQLSKQFRRSFPVIEAKDL